MYGVGTGRLLPRKRMILRASQARLQKEETRVKASAAVKPSHGRLQNVKTGKEQD